MIKRGIFFLVGFFLMFFLLLSICRADVWSVTEENDRAEFYITPGAKWHIQQDEYTEHQEIDEPDEGYYRNAVDFEIPSDWPTLVKQRFVDLTLQPSIPARDFGMMKRWAKKPLELSTKWIDSKADRIKNPIKINVNEYSHFTVFKVTDLNGQSKDNVTIEQDFQGHAIIYNMDHLKQYRISCHDTNGHIGSAFTDNSTKYVKALQPDSYISYSASHGLNVIDTEENYYQIQTIYGGEDGTNTEKMSYLLGIDKNTGKIIRDNISFGECTWGGPTTILDGAMVRTANGDICSVGGMMTGWLQYGNIPPNNWTDCIPSYGAYRHACGGWQYNGGMWGIDKKSNGELVVAMQHWKSLGGWPISQYQNTYNCILKRGKEGGWSQPFGNGEDCPKLELGATPRRVFVDKNDDIIVLSHHKNPTFFDWDLVLLNTYIQVQSMGNGGTTIYKFEGEEGVTEGDRLWKACPTDVAIIEIAQNKDDNEYVGTGWEQASNSLYVVGINPIDGSINWSKIYSGITGWSIKPCPENGGFIIAGEGDQDGNGINEALLLKITKDGNQEWMRIFTESASHKTYFRDAIETKDHGYIAVGHYENPADYVYVVKTDKYGQSCSQGKPCD